MPRNLYAHHFSFVMDQFNNAGIMHPADDNALNTEEKIWDLTQAINVKGVWYGCKHAILAMRNNPTDESKNLHVGGSIINTASFVAIMGAATPQIAYTASKGAVLAMTRELAMVHAREGIRVNSLCPYVQDPASFVTIALILILILTLTRIRSLLQWPAPDAAAHGLPQHAREAQPPPHPPAPRPIRRGRRAGQGRPFP